MKSFRFLFFVLLVASTNAFSQTTRVVFVNGIQNTLLAASESRINLKSLLDESRNHSGSKVEFEVHLVYNPTGLGSSSESGWTNCELCQELKELFIMKTSEEHYSEDFSKLLAPHNASNEVDHAAAIRVNDGFVSDLTPGNNDLELEGKITDSLMSPNFLVINRVVNEINSSNGAIVVPHSQGNLLVNMAYAKLIAEYGASAAKKVRVVNVANTTRFSISSLSITNENDAALFSGIFYPESSLQTLATRKGWKRTTPDCHNALCQFKVALPTFSEINGGDSLRHGFVTTYQSEIDVSREIIPQGVAYSNAHHARDRLEDLIYAAKRSLDFSSNRLAKVLYDDFNGATLDSSKWSSLPCRSAGDPTFAGNGQVHFGSCQSATTQGKVTFSGKKIVIEARFAGPKGAGRDTAIALVNPATGDFFQFGDTDYESRGVYAYLYYGGKYEYVKPYGGTTTAFKEYRVTIDGTNVMIQRGDSLSNLTETYAATLPYSATNGTYYLRIGTGADWYAPADFDWINVYTDDNYIINVDAKQFTAASTNIAVDSGSLYVCRAGIVGNAPPWGEQANSGVWAVNAPAAGTYLMEANYAALESRPLKVSVNDAVVTASALSNVTGGWCLGDAKTYPVGVVTLKAGANTLRLDRASVFPHLASFRFTRQQ